MNGTKRESALITGAGGGLGGAFALEAARRGWDLILVDLPGTGLEDVGRRLARAYKVEARCFEMDLADAGARRGVADWIRDNGIALALLVNCAGTGCCSAFHASPRARIEAIVEVNLQATVQLTHLLLPSLMERPRAAIINVSSLSAFFPMPSMAVYAASKTFLLNFSLALRGELASTGVRVSALCPAGLVTSRELADQVAAQGFMGRITTMETERVAAIAVRQALRGNPVIIPGTVNRILRYASSLVPRWIVIRIIGSRWRKTERLMAGRQPDVAAAVASA
jgi:uncharacterized protein